MDYEAMSVLGLGLRGFCCSKSLVKSPMLISSLNLNSLNPNQLHRLECNTKFLLNFGFAFFFQKKEIPHF